MKFLHRKCYYNTVSLSFSLRVFSMHGLALQTLSHFPHTTVIWHQITWISRPQRMVNHLAPKILHDVANELLEVWLVTPCCWKNLYISSVTFSKNCAKICVIYILLNLLCPEIWIYFFFALIAQHTPTWLYNSPVCVRLGLRADQYLLFWVPTRTWPST